jgi:hypothetical protein
MVNNLSANAARPAGALAAPGGLAWGYMKNFDVGVSIVGDRDGVNGAGVARTQDGVTLAPGALNFALSKIPAELKGADWIQVANDGRNNPADAGYFSFVTTAKVDVYIGIGMRMGWLVSNPDTVGYEGSIANVGAALNGNGWTFMGLNFFAMDNQTINSDGTQEGRITVDRFKGEVWRDTAGADVNPATRYYFVKQTFEAGATVTVPNHAQGTADPLFAVILPAAADSTPTSTPSQTASPNDPPPNTDGTKENPVTADYTTFTYLIGAAVLIIGAVVIRKRVTA